MTASPSPLGPTPARIERALRAGTRGLALCTPEEARAVELCEAVGEALGWRVHTWSAASGIDGDDKPTELGVLLERLRRESADALWLALDGDTALGGARERRALREVATRDHGPAIVLVGSVDAKLLDAVPELVVEVLPPPAQAELEARIEWIAGELEASGYEGARGRLAAAATRLARACVGLGLRTLDRLIAEAVLDHGPDPLAIERFVARAKPGALDRAGLLTPVRPATLEELGGMAEFKAWLQRRALALHPRAREAGIPDPRGALLLGVQGCGKSLAARVCGTVLDLPVVRLELGRLFGGTVGESEANLRRAIASAERIAPVVVWIDEIDKGLAGIDGGASDGGTAARVAGALLTWLQERDRPVFVVATANRFETLPPELTRRGRLDEVFFVDLPDADAREAIAHVHLDVVVRNRLGQAPPTADDAPAFARVARNAEGFSGAELESAIVDARLAAFAQGRPLGVADFESAIQQTVPLSVARRERVESLRSWAANRARKA